LDDESFGDGLLSQWRGYGADGGFAIQFDTSQLEKLMVADAKTNVHSMFSLTDVIFGEKSSDFRFAEDDIEAVAAVARLLIPRTLGLTTGEPDLNPLYVPFVKSATRFKNSGFAEEREVRFVYVRPEDSTVPKDRAPPKPVEFRPHRGSWIPFVRLFAPDEMKLPIQRILVGPHPRAKLRTNTLELFLKEYGISAEVAQSKIPYMPE
jgi:hypothetical protein